MSCDRLIAPSDLATVHLHAMHDHRKLSGDRRASVCRDPSLGDAYLDVRGRTSWCGSVVNAPPHRHLPQFVTAPVDAPARRSLRTGSDLSSGHPSGSDLTDIPCSSAHRLHQRVDHLPDSDGPLVAAPLGMRDQRLLLVRQVAWIAKLATFTTSAVLVRPHAVALSVTPTARTKSRATPRHS